jgi:hypothetical protein
MTSWRTGLPIAWALAALFLCAASALLGQGGWQPETRLTDDPDTSTVGPNNGKYMAIDARGDLHIVWVDHRDKMIRIFHKMKSAGVWSDDEPVTSKGGHPARPVIAFDRSGVLHLVWNDDRTGNMEIYHTVWYGVWGEVEQITSTPGDSFGASIVTEGDTVHVVYMERIAGHLQIMYRHYYDFEWSPAYPLTNVATGDRMVPTIAKGPDNSLHVAWWDTRADSLIGKIYYRARVGGVWLDEECLTNPAYNAMRPNIAVDDSLGVHVAWIDARGTYEQIYYRHRGSGGWDPEVAVTTESATHYHPSIGVAGGDVFLAYWDNHLEQTNSEIFFKRRTAGAWSGRFQVSNGGGLSIFPCLITEPNRNFHIAWVDGRDGNLEIYYRNYVDPANGVGGGGDETPAAAVACRLEAYPNPFRGSTSIELSMPDEREASVCIYSVDGRCVRRLVGERLPQGTHRFAWDGRDDRGRSVAPGAYVAAGKVGKTRINAKIVLLR